MNTTKPIVRGPINGNAFSIMGAVVNALRDAGATKETIKEYREKAMSGDYDNLLSVSMGYVDFELDNYDDPEPEDEDEWEFDDEQEDEDDEL